MATTGTRIDPDEALWDKARGMLADELMPADFAGSFAREYVETHAPAYAAALIREEEEDEALYDEAHARLALAFGDSLPRGWDTAHYLIARAAPVVVHTALEARATTPAT